MSLSYLLSILPALQWICTSSVLSQMSPHSLRRSRVARRRKTAMEKLTAGFSWGHLWWWWGYHTGSKPQFLPAGRWFLMDKVWPGSRVSQGIQVRYSRTGVKKTVVAGVNRLCPAWRTAAHHSWLQMCSVTPLKRQDKSSECPSCPCFCDCCGEWNVPNQGQGEKGPNTEHCPLLLVVHTHTVAFRLWA